MADSAPQYEYRLALVITNGEHQKNYQRKSRRRVQTSVNRPCEELHFFCQQSSTLLSFNAWNRDPNSADTKGEQYVWHIDVPGVANSPPSLPALSSLQSERDACHSL